MNTPPFLIGAALAFWGWQNGLLIWGILAGALIEASRWARARWDLKAFDLNRIFDLCVLLFAATALLLYSMDDRLTWLFRLVEWLPLCLLPIMLAQAYGNHDRLRLSVFWLLLRRRPDSTFARKSLNISYCYFAMCLLSASMASQNSDYFYAGITLLVGFGLGSRWPRRVSRFAWIVLFALAVNVGAMSHQGLRNMQDSMERALGSWLASLLGSASDPRECTTNIGGRPYHHSGHIIYRVKPESGSFAPQLLRETIWDEYKKERWLNSNADFTASHAGGGDTVKLTEGNYLSNTVEISTYIEGGEGIFAVPPTTFELNDFAANLKTNRLGVLHADMAPSLLIFHASFGAEKSIDSPPNRRDLMVPEVERPVMAQIINDLHLDGMSDLQKIRAIGNFFHGEMFKYSLDAVQHRDPTWLGYFLNTSHAGHCEYYATATVLLLRQAGVPARYATGFLLQDNSKNGDTFLLRDRDRHAWALAYHGDSKYWEQLDTTPGATDRPAGPPPPWWEPVNDMFSNLYFDFSKWRLSKTSYARYSIWLLVPLILFLAGRIIFSQRRQKLQRPKMLAPVAWPGLDSELYLINRELAAAQLDRLPNEPLQSWQLRLEKVFPESERLRRIFRLHRRLRFDPLGLASEQRASLRVEVKGWLEEFAATSATRQ